MPDVKIVAQCSQCDSTDWSFPTEEIPPKDALAVCLGCGRKVLYWDIVRALEAAKAQAEKLD